MSVHLVYHRPNDIVSPFDKRAIAIARGSKISIACPYLTLKYIRRLIKLSRAWRLVTDAEEWMASLRKSQRKKTVAFIETHHDEIRHSPGMHAKLLLGSNAALLGSANFTSSGIQSKTELGVFIKDDKLRKQLVKWFEDLWTNSFTISASNLQKLADELPDSTDTLNHLKIAGQVMRRHAALVTLDELSRARTAITHDAKVVYSSQADFSKTIYVYKNARGCFINGIFHVLADSAAVGNVSATFETISNGRYRRKRNRLIADGILTRNDGELHYTFTVDSPFNSKSEAAYLIDGNSRSGSVWKRT